MVYKCIDAVLKDEKGRAFGILDLVMHYEDFIVTSRIRNCHKPVLKHRTRFIKLEQEEYDMTEGDAREAWTLALEDIAENKREYRNDGKGVKIPVLIQEYIVEESKRLTNKQGAKVKNEQQLLEMRQGLLKDHSGFGPS